MNKSSLSLQGSKAGFKLLIALRALENEIVKTCRVLMKHRHAEQRDLYEIVEQLEETCVEASDFLYGLRRDYATINPTRYHYGQASKLLRALGEHQKRLRNLQDSLKPKPLTGETMVRFPDLPKEPSFSERFWCWAIPAIVGCKGTRQRAARATEAPSTATGAPPKVTEALSRVIEALFRSTEAPAGVLKPSVVFSHSYERNTIAAKKSKWKSTKSGIADVDGVRG